LVAFWLLTQPVLLNCRVNPPAGPSLYFPNTCVVETGILSANRHVCTWPLLFSLIFVVSFHLICLLVSSIHGFLDAGLVFADDFAGDRDRRLGFQMAPFFFSVVLAMPDFL
jgi:hypothetical protein